ncbi:FMN-binding glutamate synthase family protein [Photobacterium carnosum]|uniref:FMN-binding glutamate synthase family protein n=1 Tax=Photobacterium carnosum TaxID=2023717 RepID=UPI001E2AD0E4|nr:FMN-binding glutamate synthase family protein [Photobacterium carnosum]MCD9500364.1 FMN-binding glutamate synthase family protein [Photobacterium carnosum]
MFDHIFIGVIVLSNIFLFFIGVLFLILIYMYIADKNQHKHAIRYNYPIIGRFRYLFEKQGEFFRQYFFAMDREEMPFNRAERTWVYKAAKNIDRTIAFGSTRDLEKIGTVIFLNCPFPTLEEDIVESPTITIGERCIYPYKTKSIFNISGMSFGAISKPAVLALSHGAKIAGCWLNTGEGGVSQYHLDGGCDLVYQIGTAKYGVRNEDGGLDDEKLMEIAAHNEIKMFEIKMSQGAKPGKGGILPGRKVTKEIAEIRGIPVGKDSISPNGHKDIQSITELLDMIVRIKKITGKPVGFKCVIGTSFWIDELFLEIKTRGIDCAPDFITIDGCDGGTGAAPQPLMDYVGLPLKESLPIVTDLLNKYSLKEEIKIIASGKLITPSKVAWALALGADFVVSARGHMFALGCIQALQCNKDTCPSGIATHNKRLQLGLNVNDKKQRVANYNKYINYGLGIIAHSCGLKEIRQISKDNIKVINKNGLSVALDKMYD